MSKIQDLKGTHNFFAWLTDHSSVVSDVKDTRFERNSQPRKAYHLTERVVSDVKDTRFERNSQHVSGLAEKEKVVSDVKDTRFERNSQL